MHTKFIIRLTMAALVVFALTGAPVAAAQQHASGSTAPMAQSGSSAGFTFVEPGQQSSTTPMPKVARSSGNWDPQAPPVPPAPPAPPATEKSSGQAPKIQMPMIQMPKGQLVNVKVEFTITDQLGAKPPTRKTMTLTVADKENGRIRTNTEYPVSRGNSYQMSQAPLSVDVFPTIDGGKIRLDFSLEYNLFAEKEANLPADAPGAKTNVSERLSAILDSGVPLIIAQSSDALTDRKLTIEVKATIVK